MSQDRAKAMDTVNALVNQVAAELDGPWTVERKIDEPDVWRLIGSGNAPKLTGGGEIVEIAPVLEKRPDGRTLRVDFYGVNGTARTYAHLDRVSLREAVVELVPRLSEDRPEVVTTMAGMRGFFRKVIGCLERTFAVEDNDEGWPWRVIGREMGTGVQIVLRNNALPRTGVRIEIEPWWPKDLDGREIKPPNAPLDLGKLKISCAAKRGPKAVANEINRRLLPQLRPLYREAVAYQQKVDARILAGRRLWDELKHTAERFGDPDDGRKRLRLNTAGEENMPFAYGEVKVTNGQASIEVAGVPPAVAVQIVELLCTSVEP